MDQYPGHNANDTDEDETTLSPEAMAALREFYSEQAEIQKCEEAVRLAGVNSTTQFQENWQLSQFWYDKETADTLAKEVLKASGESQRIACVSCPTIFNRLREIKSDSCFAKLFEFDKRFSALGEDFIFYDYNEPLSSIPNQWRNSFDVVIADPPFLSEECLKNISQTIKALAKNHIILCTGATMEQLANSLMNLHICHYQPKHEKKLQNEFRCFANYDLDSSIYN